MSINRKCHRAYVHTQRSNLFDQTVGHVFENAKWLVYGAGGVIYCTDRTVYAIVGIPRSFLNGLQALDYKATVVTAPVEYRQTRIVL